jgi:hypothetical protein
MLYREIIAVCSEIHTKHINTVCGQNTEFVSVKLVVRILTTGVWRINLLKPTGYVMHQQFNIQQLYALPTLCLCVFAFI